MSPVLAVAAGAVVTWAAPLVSVLATPMFLLILAPFDLIIQRLPEESRFRAKTGLGSVGQILAYALCDLIAFFLASLLLRAGGVAHLLPLLFGFCVFISLVYLGRRRVLLRQRIASFVGSVVAVVVAWIIL